MHYFRFCDELKLPCFKAPVEVSLIIMCNFYYHHLSLQFTSNGIDVFINLPSTFIQIAFLARGIYFISMLLKVPLLMQLMYYATLLRSVLPIISKQYILKYFVNNQILLTQQATQLYNSEGHYATLLKLPIGHRYCREVQKSLRTT